VTNDIRQRLQEIRHALLDLHKTLVDSERVSYEKTVGTIPSPNHFLKLLTTDPWFAWLQPLSQLIVTMDEALEVKTKNPATDADAESLIKQTNTLLVASEESEGFARHYFDALQRDPDVVLAHADAAKLFSPRKPKG
jgi:phosphoglycolate phosphatase-like HAD superfamily hydrolase